MEKEPSLFGIDPHGRVWTISHQGNSRTTWSPLPNPGKVDFKRLSALHDSAWGISSDHQIYVYLQKPDIPIRVREETFENQRWNPLGGFCDNLLPTDRYPYSNEEGTVNKAKDLIKLPSDAWIWKGDWQIENTFGSEILGTEGWTYAVDFPATYAPDKDWKSCVRRRKWYRIREYIATSRWNQIPAVDEDYTKDPFTDVGASNYGSSHQDVSCVWAVTVNGQVYHRKSVSRYSPEGSAWIHVPVAKGVQDAAQISVAANGTPFVVTWTGNVLFRVGITPQNLAGTDWITANGPPGGIFQLSAGKDSLWAITRDRKCWSLKGELQKILSKKTVEPFEWMEIPGRMKAISVSKTDLVVLALANDDCSVYFRFGVAPDQLHGQGWKEAFAGVAWDALSVSSTMSESSQASDQVDGASGGSQFGSDEEYLSIRPDIPQGCPIVEAGDHNAGPVTLCWIDGGCMSSLKTGPEPDLEVGPWRNEILTGLQFNKCNQRQFNYPNAVESSSSSWVKSIKARLLIHQKASSWMKGELEITSGDTLVFYQKLQQVWICAVPDILSVMLSRDKSDALTLRVRNSIEPGVADFVTFKFENEHNMEEWRTLLLELSTKPHDQWNLANSWVTTTAGEVHEGGLLKMCDTPISTDVVTQDDSSHVKVHHPLVKGFLPGSEMRLTVVIPEDAVRFALNLNGRDSAIFHFNPRIQDKVVVRNTCDARGEWGDEERDGVFPFCPGQKYDIQIACTESQLITTVSSKHKFIFHYKHRVPLKYITHFAAVGDVQVVDVHYEPAKGEDVKQIEFITNPLPGHFWKVDSIGIGITWAIGADMSAWVYTGGKGYRNKSENDNVVTDEQVYAIYENQRWNPLTGFGSHGLPTDRSPWSDETGRIPLEKDAIKLHSNRWAWIAEWEIDYEVKGGVDKFGWQYAIDFPASYHSSKRFNDFVRRRRWKRIARHTTSGPWVSVPNVKLVDLCIRMNDDCDYEVLAVCQNGDAVVRRGMSRDNPVGSHWEPLTSQKPFISISSWYKEKIWAIGKDGFAYIRYQNNWQLLDRPGSAPLKHIRAGPTGIWAVGTNNVLYRRTDCQPVFPEGKDWAKVCDGVSQVTLGQDDSLWALLKTGDHFHCSIAKRKGFSPNNPNGIGWEVIAEGPWRFFSITGAYSRNL